MVKTIQIIIWMSSKLWPHFKWTVRSLIHNFCDSLAAKTRCLFIQRIFNESLYYQCVTSEKHELSIRIVHIWVENSNENYMTRQRKLNNLNAPSDTCFCFQPHLSFSYQLTSYSKCIFILIRKQSTHILIDCNCFRKSFIFEKLSLVEQMVENRYVRF